MEETRINIAADMNYGEYNITVKATGKGDYSRETGATFKLTIVFKNDDFVINFTNINFKNAVKSYYNITNDVIYGDIKNKINLDVTNKGITNMEEIKYFTSLEELYCFSNQLRSLDLSKNTRLIDLKCGTNQLRSLDIRGMREVQNLIFSNTALRTLKAHQNIKDHQKIIDLKTARGNNVTISTYSTSAGSTTYELICSDYAPRAGGGSCND